MRHRDFSFRLPTRGLLFGERALQETLNDMGLEIQKLVARDEVEAWQRLARVLTHEIMNATAPYPGITLRYYTVSPGSNNIIRFIRIRRGQEKDVNDGADASTQRHAHSHIFHPADGKQYICCFFQHSITELMSPAIIDRFEFIHIKDKQRVFLILS